MAKIHRGAFLTAGMSAVLAAFVYLLAFRYAPPDSAEFPPPDSVDTAGAAADWNICQLPTSDTESDVAGPGLCPQAFEAGPVKGSLWLHEAVLTGEGELVEESEPGGGAP